jgi:glutathione S-transferase
MLELYHGTTSVCAQKARLTLAEKELEWKSHLMALNGDQLDPAYLKLNPNGVVPTLVHDGNVIVESTVIMHYLDDTFPTPPLMPRYPLDRTRAHMFKKLMDEYIHPACIVFTFATANRARLASLSKEQRDAQLAKAPLQRQSECKRAAVEEGLNSPMGKEATKSFEKLLKWIQESTENGPWLAGPDFSLADIAAIPYMVRLGDAEALAHVGQQARCCQVVGARQNSPVLRDGDHEVAAAGGHLTLREDRRPLGRREQEPRTLILSLLLAKR